MPSVTRKTQSNRSRRRDALRRELLVAIEELVSDGESFTEISVERLVSKTGISRSTFYVYFEDKGELLRAWFQDIRSQVDDAVGGWWALDGDASRDDLRRALSTVVTAYRPHIPLMAAAADAAAYDPAVREEFEELVQRNTAGLRRHIQDGQKAGAVAPNLLPAETAAWLTWMAERGFHQLVRDASDEDLERLVESYTDIIWSTLYAPATARS
ncbi:TetR/AcrR family transcriptional regulator [Patulibacter sp.]|uniref:TetR/AcrR family transcriptional regulator n=1 Tax=Patulibacter sp. TaxID=1912859 RepID=UPI0027222DF7|nr:TetR/AcrR family transcriptional regulator [Patulibacter sp.]MDO9409372.1 TetR/AcrR family transcriptional regulator [Patulibacter sp.]